jgi:hypothetical protein
MDYKAAGYTSLSLSLALEMVVYRVGIQLSPSAIYIVLLVPA